MKSVYYFKDYKKYLFHLVYEENISITSLAEGAGCHRPYLSKVLNGSQHLTPDQTFGISEFLQHLPDEREYLKLMVEYERSASRNFRSHLHQDIERRHKDYFELKNQVSNLQVQVQKDLGNEPLYYSSWLYAAIHIATSIPELQTAKAMAQRWGLREAEIEAVCQKLADMNLIKRERARWVWLSGDIHLPRESPLNIPLQANWLSKAQQNVQLGRSESIHYSVVQSLKKSDIDRLRIQISEWIREFSKVAGPSKPEELVVFRIDFFLP